VTTIVVPARSETALERGGRICCAIGRSRIWPPTLSKIGSRLQRSDGRGWVRTSDLSRVKGGGEGGDSGVNPVDKPDSGDSG
jgi:hypothetical protein